MSNSDIVTNVNTSSIIEITAEINNSILTHTQFTNMKELTSSMDTRLAPPISVFRTFSNSNFEGDLERVGRIYLRIPPREIYIVKELISFAMIFKKNNILATFQTIHP